MSTNADSSRKISLSELSERIGKALDAGKGQDEIIHYLATHGWTEDSARGFVGSIAQAQQPNKMEQTVSAEPRQAAARPLSPAPARTAAPACSVCGRQDETLRVIAYPFVFSLVFVTFRRSFTGLWCATHRNLYLVLAGLITATIGWLGIPFGLVFTPIALFGLAKGGTQPKENNSALLRAVAEHKLNTGDVMGAVRSLEASMRFDDNVAIRERLRQIRSAQGLTSQQDEGCQQEIVAIIKVLVGAIGIGAAVGGIDYLFTMLFVALTAEGTSLWIAILGWTPLIAGAFTGGLLLAQSIDKALTQIKCRTLTLALSLGILAAILAAYSIAQMAAVADVMLAVFQGGFESTAEMILLCLLSFTLGGTFWLVDSITSNSLADTIYVVIMAIAVVYYLWVAVRAAVQTTHWQQKIAEQP